MQLMCTLLAGIDYIIIRLQQTACEVVVDSRCLVGPEIC
jgi:hypothetical protein